jgi:hypothetical protein
MIGMKSETHGREISKFGAALDFAAGSVQAVTECGQVLIASNTSSQHGSYIMGSGKFIWAVGPQKIVKDIYEGQVASMSIDILSKRNTCS